MKELNIAFEPLKAEDIEVRIGSTTKKTYTLLLYKNARVDMQMLDRYIGRGYWQREHKILGNDIYCRVGIWNEELKTWVWVEDAGSSGSIEIEKSKASDSFKRACVNLGIGRELYTAPEIKLWKENENDDSFKYKRFYVKEIEYKNGDITKLVICDQENDSVVFIHPKGAKVSQNAQKPQENTKPQPSPVAKNEDSDDENMPIREQEKEWLQQYMGNLSAENYDKVLNWLFKKFGTKTIGELTASQGVIAVNSLKKAGIK